MASRRMISTTLGDSEKFSNLKNDTHRLAYVLLITYADSEGRFIADSTSLRGKLYTRMEWSTQTVESALHDMHDAQLIKLYTSSGKRYGVIVDFHKHNTIRLKPNGSPRDEGKSKLPEPPDPLVAGDPLLPDGNPRSTLGTQNTTRSGATPEWVRSNPGPGPAEVEVEVEVEREVEVEGNARAPETDDSASSEARTMHLLTTGNSDSRTAPRARAFFNRLIGADNTKHPQCKDNLTRWYQDYTEDELHALWKKARDNPENKARLWYFIDALNGLKPTNTKPIDPGPTPEEVRNFWGDMN